MRQRKARSLLAAWVIMGLGIIVLSSASCTSSEQDLLNAADNGDLSLVRTLLEKGTEIDHQDEDGTTALILASYEGHVEVVHALLAKGAKMDLQDKAGWTALHYASSSFGNAKTVQALLAKGANMDLQDKDGRTALKVANTKKIKEMLKTAASDGQDLLNAADNGDLSLVRALLEKGVDINHIHGYTALFIASQNGHAEVAQFLLAKGANMDLQAINGATALIMASQNGHAEIVQALLAKGAKMDLQDKDGRTALKVAKTKKIKEMLKAAISNKK